MIFDLARLEHFPTKAGVYLMKNEKGEVIYVGKAKQLKARIRHYFLSHGDTRPMIPLLIEQTSAIETIVVPSEREALLLENTLIKKHQPKFNAVLKDDKTFISLMINIEHPWPKLSLVRCKSIPKDKRLYFGPYTSAYAAKKSAELLSHLFPLRQCSDEELKRRSRPCLLYSIKRCLAPCIPLCTKEEYGELVQKTVQFLKGEDKEILKQLRKEMEEAAKALEFERAASLLETMRHLEHVLGSSRTVVSTKGTECDALGLYREGAEVALVLLLFREGNLVGSESHSFHQNLEEDEALLSSFLLQHYQAKGSLPKEILLPFLLPGLSLLAELLSERAGKKVELLLPSRGEKLSCVNLARENAKILLMQERKCSRLSEEALFDLQTLLKLDRYPRTIVCLDTSHLAGSDPVASLVTFVEGKRDPKQMRLYKIKTAPSSDDYAALEEVLRRYLSRAKEEEALPDLIIVDGGKGQLHRAEALLKQLDVASVDLIALTKEAGRHDKGITAERIFLTGNADPLSLHTHSPLLFLLQNIRDEAHRKAIEFHKKRRTKRHLTSQLDALAGIGPIKKRRLLRHFGSIEGIKRAGEEELKEVKGLSSKDIQTLKKALNRDT